MKSSSSVVAGVRHIAGVIGPQPALTLLLAPLFVSVHGGGGDGGGDDGGGCGDGGCLEVIGDGGGSTWEGRGGWAGGAGGSGGDGGSGGGGGQNMPDPHVPVVDEQHIPSVHVMPVTGPHSRLVNPFRLVIG